MDQKTRSKVRALLVFEVAIFGYLAGIAAVQVYIVFFRK